MMKNDDIQMRYLIKKEEIKIRENMMM